MLTFDNLQLGDTVYESCPWRGVVIERPIIRVAEFQEKGKYESLVKTRRKLWVDGGILGAGEEISASDLNAKYFATRAEARENCVTRAVELRAEHQAQLQKEAARIAEELKELEQQ